MKKIYFLILISLGVHAKQNVNNKIIAHRGAWKMQNLPQNSRAALKNAIKLGCYGSEFDVRMTLDSVLVINHDPEFQGMEIEKTTFSALKSKQLSNGETLPTLQEFIEIGKTQTNTKLT